MIIAYGNINFHIPSSNSLKEKRRVLQSIISKLKNSFNISLCEIEGQDTWQYVGLGFVGVANKKYILESMLNQIEEKLNDNYEINLINFEIEYI